MESERNALAELAEDIENCRIARCRSMHSYDAKTLIKSQRIVAELAKICLLPDEVTFREVTTVIMNCRAIAEEGVK